MSESVCGGVCVCIIMCVNLGEDVSNHVFHP